MIMYTHAKPEVKKVSFFLFASGFVVGPREKVRFGIEVHIHGPLFFICVQQ